MNTTSTKTKISALAFLTVSIIAVYSSVITHDFLTYDDNRYILNNPSVSDGLSWRNVTWAFTIGYEGNWHPLTWLSHMVDVTLFGLNPGLHHAVNLLWHIVNTLLLLSVLNIMTKRFWPSFMVPPFQQPLPFFFE